MLIEKGINKFLFCCLTDSEIKELKNDIERNDYSAVYRYQQNLEKQENDFCCKKCGKKYPKISLSYKKKNVDLKDIKKFPGETVKYKNPAVFFKPPHYYIWTKNKIKKYDITNTEIPLSEIKITPSAITVSISSDEKYIFAKTVNKSVYIYDVDKEKQLVKKQLENMSGDVLFHENKLLYFSQNKLHMWDFVNDTEKCIDMGFLTAKETEKRITASTLLYNDNKKMFIIELYCSKKNYVIATDMLNTEIIIVLENRPTLTRIMFDQQSKTYTVPFYDYCTVTDENFNVIEKIKYPKVCIYSDGGGFFPITYFEDTYSDVFISPDKRYFFSNMTLIDRKKDKIVFSCLNSDFKNNKILGFLPGGELVYILGRTTYFQTIKH